MLDVGVEIPNFGDFNYRFSSFGAAIIIVSFFFFYWCCTAVLASGSFSIIWGCFSLLPTFRGFNLPIWEDETTDFRDFKLTVFVYLNYRFYSHETF